MQSTEIVRKLNNLGRIVIPMELRRNMGIGEKVPLEILVDHESVILKSYQPRGACVMTGDISSENNSLTDGKVNLSPESAKEVAEELKRYLQGVK